MNSAELDREKVEHDERDDGLGLRKKKTKPSARKAANLSGRFLFFPAGPVQLTAVFPSAVTYA